MTIVAPKVMIPCLAKELHSPRSMRTEKPFPKQVDITKSEREVAHGRTSWLFVRRKKTAVIWQNTGNANVRLKTNQIGPGSTTTTNHHQQPPRTWLRVGIARWCSKHLFPSPLRAWWTTAPSPLHSHCDGLLFGKDPGWWITGTDGRMKRDEDGAERPLPPPWSSVWWSFSRHAAGSTNSSHSWLRSSSFPSWATSSVVTWSL